MNARDWISQAIEKEEARNPELGITEPSDWSLGVLWKSLTKSQQTAMTLMVIDHRYDIYMEGWRDCRDQTNRELKGDKDE